MIKVDLMHTYYDTSYRTFNVAYKHETNRFLKKTGQQSISLEVQSIAHNFLNSLLMQKLHLWEVQSIAPVMQSIAPANFIKNILSKHTIFHF